MKIMLILLGSILWIQEGNAQGYREQMDRIEQQQRSMYGAMRDAEMRQEWQARRDRENAEHEAYRQRSERDSEMANQRLRDLNRENRLRNQ